MKRLMKPDELARDERFTRTAVPLDFLMAEEVTVEQVEETMKTIMANDEMREAMEKQAAEGGTNLFRRVRPDEPDAPIFIKSQMHGIFMGEMQALEAAGRSAWDFTDDPELPWKFQLDMSRQCWDETRHVEIYSALLHHVGADIGEFPENLFLFEFGCSDDPAERVVGVNRCLEGLALDVFNDTIRFGKQADDEAIWRSVDYVSADEVTHVRFGQVWSRVLTDNDPDRRQKVLNFQRKVDRAFSLGGIRGVYDGANADNFLPLAVEFRKLAGFSDEDIAEVAGAGPVVTGL
ncbi:MAG: DUF455 family protein [Acidimicrobiales bacterium]